MPKSYQRSSCLILHCWNMPLALQNYLIILSMYTITHWCTCTDNKMTASSCFTTTEIDSTWQHSTNRHRPSPHYLPILCLKGRKITIWVLRKLTRDSRQSKVLHFSWILLFPDEAINCKMPRFSVSVLSLLWAGKWETECLSRSIAVFTSSSNCMIGIISFGVHHHTTHVNLTVHHNLSSWE